MTRNLAHAHELLGAAAPRSSCTCARSLVLIVGLQLPSEHTHSNSNGAGAGRAGPHYYNYADARPSWPGNLHSNSNGTRPGPSGPDSIAITLPFFAMCKCHCVTQFINVIISGRFRQEASPQSTPQARITPEIYIYICDIYMYIYIYIYPEYRY